MSLRFKTILGVGLIEAVLLVILITSIINYMRNTTEESMENYVKTTTQLFATTTKDAVLSFDLASLETFVEEILNNQGVLYVRVSDSESNILVTGGDKKNLQRNIVIDRSYQDIKDNVYDTKTPITVEGAVYGFIEMGISTERMVAAIDKAKNLAATIALTEMLLVALFSFILGVYLTRQLKVLRNSAQAVAAGDLNHKVEVTGNDEIAEVAESFNKMIVSLNKAKKESEQYHDELESLNKDLEFRVEKRTLKILEQKNKLESIYNRLDSAQKEINDLSSYDRLTGFANREQCLILLDKRTTCIGHNYQSAILLFSIDHFKRVNDSIGVDNADQLLVEVGNRVNQYLQDGDVIARPGGDTYIVLLSGEFFSKEEADEVSKNIAEEIRDLLSLPYHINEHTLHVTASVGIALFSRSDNAQSILHNAEYACHYSKINGRNMVSFFEEEMQSLVNERFKLEQDLREAVEKDELFLNFQPQVRSDLSCSSLEVLVRWIHPEEGFIPPDKFIEIAEESQLIITLGNWIMNKACEQIAAWGDEGIYFEHVAINISPIQFKQDDFVETVVDIATSHGLELSGIMLEITEGVIIDNPEDIIEKIACLKSHGIKISVDDFGTGYSSLGYLKRLPIDELKIDRSFIQEIESDVSDSVITEVIISMAQHFGYEVIAEGVETKEQKNILMDKGCHYFQGYYFSRPLPADDIPPYLFSIQPQRYSAELISRYPSLSKD